MITVVTMVALVVFGLSRCGVSRSMSSPTFSSQWCSRSSRIRVHRPKVWSARS